MDQIILPEVTEEVINAKKSVFKINPLFPGFGQTLGNSLRRVLLSSLPGAAITSVKIDGVSHEFTTVEGVKEDVVELILNLKLVRVTLHQTDQPVVITLDAKGPGKVTAKDFKASSSVTVVNPDQFIATLSAKSSLHLEATVEFGRGYDVVEKREASTKELGRIAIDSLFNPVEAVSIEVENTRVGKMTNYDLLTLTITTDGSVSPKDAFKESSAILVDQFNLLATFGDAKAAPAVAEANAEESDLADSGLSARTIKVLIENGYNTLESIKNADLDVLSQIGGLGAKAITEIVAVREQ
ncbi:MAG: DNA-directed RNA polymerase subunit alpha [Patescibacteria group bacterium]|jgi:DNA-directed RNA polymerase subunit alpha